ncbi:MAG: putative monooxygenase, FAD-binding protein [Rhizobacter sp.]|nr:putative monooxygenase, FAD-binding protein [Rhizobacter sp.]
MTEPIDPLDCDVLVIGAGPTGLMAACLLARCGVAVRIVDKRSAPSSESRAFAIQARTLELFQSLGMADALLAEGVMNTAVDIFVGGRQAGGLDFDRADSPDTPFPFILMLPQARTEAHLIEELQRQGASVERAIEVTTIETHDGLATARGTDAAGQPITIRSAYLIGADGAHSMVRKALGLHFEGHAYAQTFLLADCHVDWALDHERFRVFMNGERIGLFLPLHGSRLSRVMTTAAQAPTPTPTSGEALPPLDLAEMQQAFAEVAGVPLTLDSPAWTTRYSAHHRGVDRYRSGRAFVAGDAAHIHSPAGGQGMNTGLQDAANLAWKLAAVLRHGAGDALLDTYGSERLPVGRQVLHDTDRLFSMAAGQSGWRARLRDWLAPTVAGNATKLDLVQHAAFRKIAELELRYAASAAVQDTTGTARTAGPQAGERAPNAGIARHRDVFDLTAGYRWTLLALSRKPLAASEVDDISARLWSLAGARGDIATHLVSRLSCGHDSRVEPVESADVFDRYGLDGQMTQALLAIRPDGYVAWRSDGFAIDACAAFLDSLGHH